MPHEQGVWQVAATTTGQNYTAHLRVSGMPLYLKVAMYAYDGDVLGSTRTFVSR